MNIAMSSNKAIPPLMGEISPIVNTWRGIFRESRYGRIPCDISPVGSIQRIRDAIEAEMKRKGFSRRSLSSAAGLSESAVRDLLTRVDNPGIGTLRKVAEALEMPVDALTGAGLMVPVVGKIGAGGEVLFSLDPDAELNDDAVDMVPRPPLVTGRLMALEVVGSSMLPKYEDGEIVYCRAPSGDHGHIPEDAIGSYCAVRTSDGGTYLKVLAKGSAEGRFTLRSLNAPDMEDVEVIWASRVLFVMPRSPGVENAA
jgi:transcriptional regulator with XRE-family HTH domain